MRFFAPALCLAVSVITAPAAAQLPDVSDLSCHLLGTAATSTIDPDTPGTLYVSAVTDWNSGGLENLGETTDGSPRVPSPGGPIKLSVGMSTVPINRSLVGRDRVPVKCPNIAS